MVTSHALGGVVTMLLSVLFACSISRGTASFRLRRHEGPQDLYQSVVLDTGEAPSLSEGLASSRQSANPAKEEKNGDVLHQKDHLHKQREDLRKELEKAQKISPLTNLKRDLNMFLNYLMPGRRPDMSKKAPEAVVVLLALIWLGLFTVFIYENDRREDLDRWPSEEALGIKVREDPACIRPIAHPDLILVFHKPNHPYPDKDKKVEKHILDTALMTKQQISGDEAAHEFHKCMELFGKTTAETTLGEVRIALLQDIFHFLPKQGFDVTAFSSVDGDEIHVSIALRKEETIKHLVKSQGMKLQVQQSVVKDALRIGQDPKEYESSPPFVTYNTTISANVLGVGKTDLDFFQVFGKNDLSKGTILAGHRRIRIIFTYLTRYLNLDFALQNGMLAAWFPAHSPTRLAQLQRCWSRWSLLTDMSFVQPLSLLHDYFGSRVAFIFAWTGVYCKLLLALVPIAILIEVINYVAKEAGGTQYWNRGSVLGFSIIVAIWARVAENLWNREQEYLIAAWDLKSFENDKSVRPDFAGALRKSEVDTNRDELYYDDWKYALRLGVSWLVTFAYCFLDFSVVTMWIDNFDGDLKLGASIMLAIIVQVFTVIYNWMAEAMTIAENHKYQSQFYDSYLKKMFLFQFVNQYSAFFYIAVKQQFTLYGCLTMHGVANNCPGMIQHQLPTTLAVLAVMRVVQVVVATLKVKLCLWWESRQIEKAGGTKPVYAFVEEQSKFGEFRIREQIEVMTCLAITLGYVLIFGAIAPRIIPLCFIVFVVQLRAAAMIVTTASFRPVPRVTLGIGSWMDVVRTLLIVGVFFSGYLLVQFGPLFKGIGVLTKLSCLCLYLLFIFFAWTLVDTIVPGRCPRTAVLSARRDYVKKQLTQKSEDREKKLENARRPSLGMITDKSGPGEGRVEWAQEIDSEEWDKIPSLFTEEDAKASSEKTG